MLCSCCSTQAFHPDCVLLTPAVFEELHGHQAMAKFWRVVLEAFPDGMIEAKSTNVEQGGETFHLRFQFHGTKVAKMPTDMLLNRWHRVDACHHVRAQRAGNCRRRTETRRSRQECVGRCRTGLRPGHY